MLIHNNRMLELKIQVNTGFRMAMIYFKDSYKFMNLPLCLLPKSFNFQNELQKGFFSTLLKHQGQFLHFKSSTMPIKEHFGVDEIGEEERIRFMCWYDSECAQFQNDPDLIYDLHEEMIKYCYDDCFILASAFSRFNESMIKELRSSGVLGIVEDDYTILADYITLP